jgi:hypothetical protein
MREPQRAPGIAERPSDQQDQDLNRRLAAEAKKAADAYVKTALALNSQFSGHHCWTRHSTPTWRYKALLLVY